MKSGYAIGIDGGGSGCRVAVGAANGKIVGTGTSGAANFTSDPDGTTDHILAALRTAADNSGMPFDALLNMPTHLGLAGIMTDADAQNLASRLPFKSCRVSDDQVTSAIGALGNRNGVLVAVGTGSFVAIKRGKTLRTVGGWGLQLGDQASGAWLGRNALQRCALVADGVATTSPLITELLARFDNNAGQMITFAGIATPAEYAKLAPLIFAAAENDDSHALSLISEGAAYLALCLDSAEPAEGDIVCMAGGLGALYAPWLGAAHQARMAEPLGTALDGAVRLAWSIVDAD